MQRLIIAALMIAAVVGPSSAAKKQRDWQTGKVLDTDKAKTYLTEHTILERTLMIDTGTYVYVVSQECGGGRGVITTIMARCRPVSFTVNAPVRFAIEKHTMYLLDDDGRQIRAEIVKRILKADPGGLPNR